MKQTILLFLVLSAMINSQGQNVINVKYNPAFPVGGRLSRTSNDADVQSPPFNMAADITVKVANAPAGTKVTATYNSTQKTVTESAGGIFTIEPMSTAEISTPIPYIVTVKVTGETDVVYASVGAKVGPQSPPGPSVANISKFPNTTAVWFAQSLFSLSSEAYGIEVTSSKLANYQNIDHKYTHIFLDQFGNSLFGVIPQGISNRQYIVHIIYLANQADPNQITYSINQTKGSFNSGLVFNNAGQIGNFNPVATQGTTATPPPITYIWAHQEFALRASTDNIEFEISRNIINGQTPIGLDATIVGKRTIEMAGVFHGSFDIGLINTELGNPDYQLVPSPGNTAQTVVKESKKGSRVVVTAMATFYISPIILIEKLFGADIPDYKLTGRNFVDDHKIYERIFPSIGVSINEQTFKNVFLGLNWEVARGASVFAGVHYGEINTFRTDNGFKFEETIVNEAEYNLRKNTKWKSAFAIGANLDLVVALNLFKQK